MTSGERRASAALAGIYALRLLGLFMILPVFALYADEYVGATPALVGLAIGIYGLTQAIFQIPFGMLSDRIGRKRVIFIGLAIFAAGSVVAGAADSIGAVIVGRAMQGLGAISAAVLALTADLTREEQRTKAMAIIGVTLGLAFACAMVLGPALSNAFGFSSLFWITAGLAIAAIGVLAWLVPAPAASTFHRDTSPVPSQFRRVFVDGGLLRLDAGIAVLHMVMTASFTVLPLKLRDDASLSGPEHWKVYLVVMLGALVLMTPFVMLADRKGRSREVFLGSILVVAAAQLGLWALPVTLVSLVAIMVVYMAAFTVLEAALPSLVSRLAPADLKGTALGAYSTSQYLGVFIGGAMGGVIHGTLGPDAVFAVCAGMTIVWLILSVSMRYPPAVSTQLLRVGVVNAARAADLAAALRTVTGVRDAVVVAEEGVAYLKVDRRRLDRDALMAYSAAGE